MGPRVTEWVLASPPPTHTPVAFKSQQPGHLLCEVTGLLPWVNQENTGRQKVFKLPSWNPVFPKGRLGGG